MKAELADGCSPELCVESGVFFLPVALIPVAAHSDVSGSLAALSSSSELLNGFWVPFQGLRLSADDVTFAVTGPSRFISPI